MAKVKERLKTTMRENVAPDVVRAQSEGTTQHPVGTPENPSDKILTLANFITVCRFALTVAFLVLFVKGGNHHLALALYAIAAVTDFLDGWVARASQTVSWLGKIMDPIMDRFLLITGVLGLVVAGDLPLWVAAFVAVRDLYLLGGSVYLQKYRRRPVDVSFIGKVTTALLMTGFCVLLLGAPVVPGLGITSATWLPGLNDQEVTAGIFLVYAGVVTSFLTAVLYTIEGVAIKREALEGERA